VVWTVADPPAVTMEEVAMPLSTILLIAAVILFLLAAAPIASPLNLQALGLACLAGAQLVGAL
jgi:hypothetical protein